MKTTIDTEARTIVVDEGNGAVELDLYSDEAFRKIADLYLKVGWNQKYTYTFSWMGRPVIQLPDDMIRLQELIYSLKPDVIVETGIAHGGSLIFYASLCKAMGKGRVVGIDIDIRSHNRQAMEEHELYPLITMIEGSSVATETFEHVRTEIGNAGTVLVILDSNHLYDHVSKELEMYSALVTPGSYIISTDGVMRDVADAPRGERSWINDNPANAAEDFVAQSDGFEIVQPVWPFNESSLTDNISHWPSAYIKRTG